MNDYARVNWLDFMNLHSFAPRLLTALVLSVALAVPVVAQEPFSGFKTLDLDGKAPKANAFNAPAITAPLATAETRDVSLEARLTSDGGPLQQGLVWRVFSPLPGDDGKLPLLASAEGGSATIPLAPGDYYVNVAFGRAGATKKLIVPEGRAPDRTVMILDAGGVVLDAVSGTDVHVPTDQVSFSIYSSEVQDDGERGLGVADVKPDTIVRLNAGTYHVVSEYGKANAVVRANIQVEAGKLTEATIQHRAAQVSLKLVSEEGGEAIADTAWSILTGAGDSVAESLSAFPMLVLLEGEYVAIARNKDKIYQRTFTVASGKNMSVELQLGKNEMHRQTDAIPIEE